MESMGHVALVRSDLPAPGDHLRICRLVAFGWQCQGGHPDASQGFLGWRQGCAWRGTLAQSLPPTISRTGRALGRDHPEVTGWPGDVICICPGAQWATQTQV